MIYYEAQSPVDNHIGSCTVDDLLFTVRYIIKIMGGPDHRPVTHCYSPFQVFSKSHEWHGSIPIYNSVISLSPIIVSYFKLLPPDVSAHYCFVFSIFTLEEIHQYAILIFSETLHFLTYRLRVRRP